jgi:hypothetical protein
MLQLISLSIQVFKLPSLCSPASLGHSHGRRFPGLCQQATPRCIRASTRCHPLVCRLACGYHHEAFRPSDDFKRATVSQKSVLLCILCNRLISSSEHCCRHVGSPGGMDRINDYRKTSAYTSHRTSWTHSVGLCVGGIVTCV